MRGRLGQITALSWWAFLFLVFSFSLGLVFFCFFFLPDGKDWIEYIRLYIATQEVNRGGGWIQAVICI